MRPDAMPEVPCRLDPVRLFSYPNQLDESIDLRSVFELGRE